MPKQQIDRDKLRVQLRGLRKEALLDLLDCAIDLVPRTATAEPEEYAQAVKTVIGDFVHYDRDKYMRKARGAGTAAQRKLLR